MQRETAVELATRRRVLRLISNGMYILTSRCGDDFGAATITWLSQASFKPPLLVAAIRENSNVFRCLLKSRTAAVHILGCDQKDVAQKFFFPTKAVENEINGEPFRDGSLGVPVLANTPAHIECRLVRSMSDFGDHALVVLEVVEAECRASVRPLTIADSPWEYGG
ncbi:MAG: flavin reductase family protein [Acidobacteriia bacterium]|nr:flavin reductase family protein [Terriglobia bacterium]